MGRAAVYLLAVFALSLPAVSHGQPLGTLIAPSVLRVESEEMVVVEAHGHPGPLEVTITVSDFPQRKSALVTTTISLNAGNGMMNSAKIKVPAHLLPKDAQTKEYVYLQAKSSLFTLEKVVLVSFHSGYIFIQTDKTIYTPGSTVRYRLFTVGHMLDPNLKAVSVELMTPDGIIVEKNMVSSVDQAGIISRSYKIPDIVNSGVWKIVSKYEHAPQEAFTAEFEVKEYVLPSFEVILEPSHKFFLVDQNELSVDISARFLYGKPVQGQAYALFGVMVENEKKSIVNSLNKVPIKNGKGSAKLTKEILQSRFPNLRDILGHSIYVTVTVLTDTGSDMVEAEKSGIRIVTSPYKILFTRSAAYFKPGLPFNLVVSVVNADGSPAPQIPVRSGTGASGVTQADGTVQLAVNTPADASQLFVKVETVVPNLRQEHQSAAVFALTAYGAQGGSGNYLHMAVSTAQLQPGHALPVSFSLRSGNAEVQKQIRYFTYLILNKGKIIRAGRQAKEAGQSLVTMYLPITPDLIPSFRIVAYYHVGQKEIVADSLWLDVQDSCMGTLKVTGAAEQDNGVQVPGGRMNLRVKGDPGARVGLVAVDKAVYVLNRKYKFSQAKIWDAVEKSDIGCTPGSGKDHVGVFADAGLLLQTNVGTETPLRAESRCSQPTRLRRSPLISGKKAAKARQYPSPHLRKCCEDGMHENPMDYSCDRRAKYILEGSECVRVFLDCCRHIFKAPLTVHRREFFSRHILLASANVQMLSREVLGPVAEDGEYLADEGIVSRSQFAESWLWQMELLPEEADPDGLASKTLLVYLEDSITTWEVLAVSLSQTRGICVADPHEITVMKQFFIDLRLPYSVVRNEQVAIRAVLYNYAPQALQVRVELIYNEKICSSSRRDSRFQQEVVIQAGASRAVSYVIIPLELGEVEIEVKAAVHGLPVADGVKKKLRVVPEGMKILKNIKSVLLDPVARGSASGEQLETIGPVDMSNVVPNTEPVTFVSVKGDIVGDTVENSIDGANLKHLIQVPAGCGEQNMIGMTPAAIATHYLDSSRQWERLGVERRAEAIKFITRGYTQQLAYRKADNSYAAFTNRPASTWLTAYVAKVFALAYRLITIDPEVLCGAVKWLILEKQKPDGVFQEDAPVIHGEMVGGYQGSEPEASLTAFVVIAMVEAREVCQQYVESLGRSIAKAGNYLARRLPDLRKPYSVAITSYALALLGHAETGERLMALSTGGTHWADPQSHLYSIESTSYALLALLKLKKQALTGPVVRWLTEQRYYGGGYGSTQATIMVFQALAQYQMDASDTQDTALDVSINLPGRSRPLLWRINRDNAMVARTERTKLTDGFTVSAKGHGKGTLSVMTVYYAPLTEGTAACKKFDFSVSVKNAPGAKKPEGALASVFIQICMRFLGTVDSTMTILDVSMPTGFSPDMDDLDKLTNRVDKYISKFELDTDLSERGSLILYLDKVSSQETDCLKFKAHQHFEVGLIQPAAVTVYEYYSLENRCTRFYHPTQESGMLSLLCEEDACRCMEEKCSRIKTLTQTDADIFFRMEAACEAGVDYVYKVQLEKVERNGMYHYFTMRILQVIKEGTEQGIQRQTRRFISPVACKAALNMLENRSYLIWGLSTDLWDLKTEMAYLLGSSTWIELWPSNEECHEESFRALCSGLEAFAQHLVATGCPS
ncbi:A.superbus venom factor 1 [Pelodiscus sinensis]|uniref:A.superbus venom factor 1 n=1 Tax=Pelodiscus sinensis TaxID=13735 RepID=UPI003F6D3412